MKLLRWTALAIVAMFCVSAASLAEGGSSVSFLTELPADAPSEAQILKGTALAVDANHFAEQLVGAERAQQMQTSESDPSTFYYEDDEISILVNDVNPFYKTRYYYTLFTAVPNHDSWRSQARVLGCEELSFMSAEAAGQTAQETAKALLGVDSTVMKVFSIRQADYDRLFLELFGSLDYQFSGNNKMEEDCYPHVTFENDELGYLVYLSQACAGITVYDQMYYAADVGMYFPGPSIAVLVSSEGMQAIWTNGLLETTAEGAVSICTAQEAAQAFTENRDYLLSETRYEVTDMRLYYRLESTGDAEGEVAMRPAWGLTVNVYAGEMEPYTTDFFVDVETKQVVDS